MTESRDNAILDRLERSLECESTVVGVPGSAVRASAVEQLAALRMVRAECAELRAELERKRLDDVGRRAERLAMAALEFIQERRRSGSRSVETRVAAQLVHVITEEIQKEGRK